VVTTHVDEAAGFATHTATGDLTLDEIGEAFEALLEDPAFKPGLPVLWDLREASITSLSNLEIQQLLKLNAKRKDARGSGRAAILVSKEVDYGIARMFQVYAEELPWETMVFRDFSQAEPWVTGRLVPDEPV
jgi:hypothetical protein